MSKLIFSVGGVCLAIDKSNPPKLHIAAFGEVNSSGWKAGTLNPEMYFMPPVDGIQDLDFLATPPSGMALQIMCPMSADVTITLLNWMKGVRVHSASGVVVTMFTDEACLVPLAKAPADEVESPRFNMPLSTMGGSQPTMPGGNGKNINPR
ncbi:hypothetical protein LXA47_25660 [Massilia sp. P8910]|uniref:hypothetical protein n=1 Tax=Massilia antarctica TaxID=2765360 RepID=UPI001E2B4DE2|nr:hypothetical protein [Massilia antarctica]MCE3606964.1 hypothetical protein [Massilia antarctica]